MYLWLQALIAQLEEKNINLQERVFLLEQELKELKAKLASAVGQSRQADGAQDSDVHPEEGGVSSDHEEDMTGEAAAPQPGRQDSLSDS